MITVLISWTMKIHILLLLFMSVPQQLGLQSFTFESKIFLYNLDALGVSEKPREQILKTQLPGYLKIIELIIMWQWKSINLSSCV